MHRVHERGHLYSERTFGEKMTEKDEIPLVRAECVEKTNNSL